MASTDNETDSSMDDILDSIRQIISEAPSGDDSSAKLSDETGQSGEPTQPVLSDQTPENLTNQLAEALIRETPPSPSGALPPGAPPAPEAANSQTPPPPGEKIMDLTKPLPAGAGPAPVSQPVSAPIPTQHAAPLELTTPPHNAPISEPVDQSAELSQPAQSSGQPQIPAAPVPAPAPASPMSGANGATGDQQNTQHSDQPPVARLTAAQSTGSIQDEVVPGNATQSDPVSAPPLQQRPNGLDALQQALRGVSSSTPNKPAGPIVDLTPIPKSADEHKPPETEPAPALSKDVSKDVTEDVTEEVTEEVTGDEGTTDAESASSVSPTERALRDLVKPMIKSWLDDNMPRLVEESLREDLDKSEKPDD